MATTTKDLEAQLEQARKDIETLALMAGDRARDVAKEKISDASAHLSALSDEARAAYEHAAAEGRKMREQTEEKIRANPLAATGIAFLAGVVLAGLLGRR